MKKSSKLLGMIFTLASLGLPGCALTVKFGPTPQTLPNMPRITRNYTDTTSVAYRKDLKEFYKQFYEETRDLHKTETHYR